MKTWDLRFRCTSTQNDHLSQPLSLYASKINPDAYPPALDFSDPLVSLSKER